MKICTICGYLGKQFIFTDFHVTLMKISGFKSQIEESENCCQNNSQTDVYLKLQEI